MLRRLPRINPTPQLEREIWIKKLAERRRPLAANDYVRDLKRAFIAQKVPPELVWLAEVESSFDRTARSPVGAAGLFQFMPDTAKRFGLSLWPRDQRFQAESRPPLPPPNTSDFSTTTFTTSAFLALAAYNYGEGSVDKLLARYQARNYDDISTHLPAETQLFVPRVEATVLKRENVRLENFSP